MTVNDLPVEHRAHVTEMLTAGLSCWYCASPGIWTAVTLRPDTPC